MPVVEKAARDATIDALIGRVAEGRVAGNH
jgi:hypothetical protein